MRLYLYEKTTSIAVAEKHSRRQIVCHRFAGNVKKILKNKSEVIKS